MLIFGPFVIVFVMNRITNKDMIRRDKMNIYFTNVMLLVIAIIASFTIGLKAYLLIQVPIILISHSMGLWLFYVQHQFDGVSWVRSDSWDYKIAAMNGSSFLKLNPVFQWFTGNIGFHHVHHLSSRIPNYNLASCHYENALFNQIRPISILESFKTFRLNLWDEVNSKMVSFRIAKKSA